MTGANRHSVMDILVSFTQGIFDISRRLESIQADYLLQLKVMKACYRNIKETGTPNSKELAR